VRPGARQVLVGGRYDGRLGTALLVSVVARPVDGRATEAVVKALAEAFGVPSRQVSLVSGLRSRDKIFEVIAPEAEARLGQLLAAG
jgi:uncharacterized protein